MKSFIKQNLNLIVLICIIFFVALIQYLPLIISNEIIYPRGGDATSHLWMTQQIIDQGNNNGINYPTSFHIVLSALHFVTGISIVQLFIIIVPFISCLVLLSLYLLVRKFINEKSALLAVFLMALISYHPAWYLRDATVVNVLAVFFFMPLIFLYLYKYLKENKISCLLVCIIFYFNNGILHTVGFLYPTVIIIISLIGILIFIKGKEIKKKALILILIFTILALINPYQIITSYFAPIFYKNISNQNISLDKNQSIIGVPIIGPKSFDQFIGHTNKFLWLIFLFSIPAIYLYYKNPEKRIAAIILIVAFLFLLFGSRTKYGIETERFSRDLTLVLVIYCSFFSFILTQNRYRKIILSLFILISVFIYIPKTIANNLDYVPDMKYLDYKAIMNLNDKFPGQKNILLSPTLKGLSDIPGPFVFLFYQSQDNFIGTECNDSVLYHPNADSSKKFYKENNIDFIYYRNQPLGWIPIQCDFKFDHYLDSADFLTKVDTYKKDSIIIKIYQIDQYKL